MPDAIFANPRLAAIYDDVDADRRDLVNYVAIVDELEARSVLDVGCGTGTLPRSLLAMASRSSASTRRRLHSTSLGENCLPIEFAGCSAMRPQLVRSPLIWPR